MEEEIRLAFMRVESIKRIVKYLSGGKQAIKLLFRREKDLLRPFPYFIDILWLYYSKLFLLNALLCRYISITL